MSEADGHHAICAGGLLFLSVTYKGGMGHLAGGDMT